jgi:hypothetical protein
MFTYNWENNGIDLKYLFEIILICKNWHELEPKDQKKKNLSHIIYWVGQFFFDKPMLISNMV